MIQTILAFFGYVKIPKEAIQLAIINEDFIKKVVIEVKPTKESTRDYLKTSIEGAHTLTQFLRSGRLISYSEGELK